MDYTFQLISSGISINGGHQINILMASLTTIYPQLGEMISTAKIKTREEELRALKCHNSNTVKPRFKTFSFNDTFMYEIV